MDTETKAYVDRKYDKVYGDVISSLERLKEKTTILDQGIESFKKNIYQEIKGIVDKEIKSLNESVDNKINIAVFKKLDVKWQAFSATLVILSIHAAVIFFIVK